MCVRWRHPALHRPTSVVRSWVRALTVAPRALAAELRVQWMLPVLRRRLALAMSRRASQPTSPARHHQPRTACMLDRGLSGLDRLSLGRVGDHRRLRDRGGVRAVALVDRSGVLSHSDIRTGSCREYDGRESDERDRFGQHLKSLIPNQ